MTKVNLNRFEKVTRANQIIREIKLPMKDKEEVKELIELIEGFKEKSKFLH